ncbi:DUF768 domain-containing protein [Mesorhizobium sp. B2-4-14]|uniref:DUF768 domain-containing protein n=1 Tax=Mesorhizobium sp. B2-4-14 TaxID=2589935 RepID=UPI00112D06F4|nr:DUF768 domain-containing protein [Mesorhizobium sp. B2-4-14]TPL12401.1 DUF768 domain-containing protein [Mesorhizobium sp. B2-4-14]
MSATVEFFRSWLQENVGKLPADTQVSIAVLAQQFEQDADAAGYGREIREEEIGHIEDAIQRALDQASENDPEEARIPPEESPLAPVIEALETSEGAGAPGSTADEKSAEHNGKQPAS